MFAEMRKQGLGASTHPRSYPLIVFSSTQIDGPLLTSLCDELALPSLPLPAPYPPSHLCFLLLPVVWGGSRSGYGITLATTHYNSPTWFSWHPQQKVITHECEVLFWDFQVHLCIDLYVYICTSIKIVLSL